MSSPIQDGLRLILRIPPKLAVDIVSKGPAVSKVRPEETLKFRPSDWCFFRGATLMLMPLLGHRTAQKRGSKKNAIEPVGSGGFEVILTLLTKTVAVQVRSIIIKFGEPGFWRLLLKFCLNWSRLL